MKYGILAIATVAGIGYIPYVSGTVGSLASLIGCIFLPTTSLVFIAIIICCVIISIISASKAEIYFNNIDDRRIVVDEFVGYMIAVAFLPRTPGYFLSSFLLFRFFDIFKTPLIYRSQSLPGGIGIVVDDALAGLFANICLQIIRGMNSIIQLLI